MSTTNDNYDTKNSDSVVSETTDCNKGGEEASEGPTCTYWVRDDCREFITDPNGEIVNLARLTAYAEHGDAIFGAEAHHKFAELKIDAPSFIEPLTPVEHGRLHAGEPELVEVDGLPMLQPEQ